MLLTEEALGAMEARESARENAWVRARTREEFAELADALDPVEASAHRRAQIEALDRDFERLMALPAPEAYEWNKRRRSDGATKIQSYYRRHVARRKFHNAVVSAVIQREEAAASVLQRAARLLRRTGRAGARAVPAHVVSELNASVAKRTLAMAKELQHAMRARADAAGAAGAGAQPNAERLATLPSWFESPAWLPGAQAPGGSSLVHALRAAAVGGITSDSPHAEMAKGVAGWSATRRALSGAIARRQVLRAQVAALHAELDAPPMLPPVLNADEADADSVIPLVPLMRPHVQAAHRRALARAAHAVDVEEAQAEAALEADRLVAASTRRGVRGASAAPPSPGRKLGMPVALAELDDLGIDVSRVSASERLWLASMQGPAAAQ